MNIDDLTVKQAREIAAMFGNNVQAAPVAHPALGKYCVIRTFAAGVHAGIVQSVSGSDVHLKDSRRIWKWAKAFTLSEVATAGIAVEGSRIGCVLPDLFLTSAIEIIPCSEESRKAIEAGHE